MVRSFKVLRRKGSKLCFLGAPWKVRGGGGGPLFLKPLLDPLQWLAWLSAWGDHSGWQENLSNCVPFVYIIQVPPLSVAPHVYIFFRYCICQTSYKIW